ncbi:MAG: 50S ribosomal protein L17 [Balneolaceae bacterium]|nr:MAG: 50S ribosomal protein L17 [Balneolaceae bacterium]
MRHLVKGRKLGRTASHRKATMMALSVALIKSERIVTTLAKAKALRSYVEPIITRSKEDSTHNRSHVFRHLRDKQATSRLFDEIAPMVADRPGGYTRIIKLGVRLGDGAEKALIELVDFNDAQPETARKKKRRTRRGGSGKKAADIPVEAKKDTARKKTDKDSASEEKATAKTEAKPAPEKETEAESSQPEKEAAASETTPADVKEAETPSEETKEPAEKVADKPAEAKAETKSETTEAAEEAKDAPEEKKTEKEKDPDIKAADSSEAAEEKKDSEAKDEDEEKK